MAPGGTLFRFPPHFGENVLPHGSHEWLPYSKDEVRLKTVNNNLSFLPCPATAASRVAVKRLRRYAYSVMGTPMIDALG